MKIHEYQAKEILRGYGVAVPRGKAVQSAEEAVAAARELMAGGKVSASSSADPCRRPRQGRWSEAGPQPEGG